MLRSLPNLLATSKLLARKRGRSAWGEVTLSTSFSCNKASLLSSKRTFVAPLLKTDRSDCRRQLLTDFVASAVRPLSARQPIAITQSDVSVRIGDAQKKFRRRQRHRGGVFSP